MAGRRTARRRREWHLSAAFGHGPVFALGLGVLVIVGAATVGMTWASGGGNARPVADVSPLASTDPGSCTLLVGNRLHSMDVDRARTLTMIAGVGTQVGAIPQQTARAFDIVLTDRTKYLPNVTQTLTILAQEDAIAATPLSLAEVQAVAAPDAMTCSVPPTTLPAQKPGTDGLTPRAEAVKTGVQDAFGKLQLAGATGAAAAQASSGTALTVSLGQINPTRPSTGWVLASWLVARESSYGVGQISFDQHNWQPSGGWNMAPAAPSAGASATAAGSPLSQAAALAANKAAATRNPSRLQIVVD